MLRVVLRRLQTSRGGGEKARSMMEDQVLSKYKKYNRFDRMAELRPVRHFTMGTRTTKVSKVGGGDDEALLSKGRDSVRRVQSVKNALAEMETPLVWIWYPWRRKPESPTPELPKNRALKNLHGAVFTDLTARQKSLHSKMLWGSAIPEERQKKFEHMHPFLSTVLKDVSGTPKSFPFWYKKYPTMQHAFENRFNVPKEMLEGYPEEMKKAFSQQMMSRNELLKAERSMYRERYAQHDLDLTSPAVRAVNAAISVRELRNHLLTNPHNNLAKFRLQVSEWQLNKQLRLLRKIDFRKYWEIIRDHDMQDVLQPSNAFTYRFGMYWRFDWNQGVAITTNIPDFMDPRGMNGCIETGRSRSEVARDLGLSYTRTLTQAEKVKLSNEALYFERLTKFKTENPEAWREEERAKFVRQFTGLFTKINKYSNAVDFPSKYRQMLGTKVLRWQSCRHGPM